jgi:hypothetical protein
MGAGSVVPTADAVWARLAATGAETEKVMRRIVALRGAASTVVNFPECQRFYFQGRAQQPNQETPSPYNVLGPAPAGQRCMSCGSGIGAVKQIKLAGQDGAVCLHVPCAEKYLAALANPPVKIPDLGPNPWGEHGATRPAGPRPSNGVEPGLSQSEIRELAGWYIDQAARRSPNPDLVATGALQKAVDGDLRQRLTELGVSREFMAAEIERVMQIVFAV